MEGPVNFNRLNAWFDGLNEPRRSLYFGAIFLAWYGPLIIAEYLMNYADMGEAFIVNVLLVGGASGLVFTMLWALSRLLRISK